MRLILIAILLAYSTGCATIVTGAGSSQSLKVTSEPSGASVYADGNLIGKTPMEASLTRNYDHTIKLTLDGYPDKTVQVSSTWNGWFLGNIVFPGFIGMIVDMADGSCPNCLSPNGVDEKLSQKNVVDSAPAATVNSSQNPYLHGYAPAMIQTPPQQ